MRIYLDVCCLSRPYDDQSQEKIRLESEATRVILEHVERGDLKWVTSSVVEFALAENPNEDKREKTMQFLVHAHERCTVSVDVVARAHAMAVAVGLRTFDALHLALAESARCDILFTVDDMFIRQAGCLAPPSSVRVKNPVRWLLESENGTEAS